MSWKYSTPSYSSRDHSSSRDSSQIKYGLGSTKYGNSIDRSNRWTSGDSKYYKSSSEAVEHSPVWAKTSITDNPASVQRLKERLNIVDEPKRDIKPIKRAETKDLTGSKTARAYGRSLTTLSLGDSSDKNVKSLRRRGDRTPDSESPRSPLSPFDNRQIHYMPTATTKLLTRKYSNELSPTTVNAISKFPKVDLSDSSTDTITVVTRATSPTPTASNVYLRTRRTDFGLEKKVPRPNKKSETVNKEVQTDREEISLSKYSVYSDNSHRTMPYTSFGSSYSPKYSGRCNYGSESRRDHLSPHVGFTECRRSVSREESDDPDKSFIMKPPTPGKTPPTSPIKEPEKKTFVRKSPPSGVRSSLKTDCAKTELAKTPNSPTHVTSPLQCKILTTETLQSPVKSPVGLSPKVTINACPDIGDVSSMSESSEDETSSDEEPEIHPAAMSVKKSVTNFLQNIPNSLPQNPSRPNLYQKMNSLSPQKINFRKIESGERAWWMESTDKVSDLKSESQEEKSPNTNNFLSPPYLLNRQFTRDMDWLKGSSEDVSRLESRSPEVNGLPNGDYREGSIHTNPVLRKREQYSKSPDHFLTEETNHQMKFNQQAPDDRTYLADFSRECSIKDLSHKLQNGLGSPLEEKNFLEPGDMSGIISKAKAGLTKSKSKLEIKKSSSREMSPKVTDTKAEIDLYWKELADSLNRPLRLCDLDFTDLNSDDETDILGHSKMNGEVPPPPPMLMLPVPAMMPLKPLNVPTPPNQQPLRGPRNAPAPPPAPSIVKNKKTVKLFWKEVKDEPVIQMKIPDGVSLIWDELSKVKVDTQKLEYLFESRAKDLLTKKQQEQNKNKEIIVLDPKRSNAINIGMTKLPPPRAIKTAILKMDSTVVNKEGIEKLLSMLPTEEEKLRIQEAQSLNPDIPLGSAEQFLLTLASINELEARLRLWAFKLDFENSEKEICEPLMDLKQGMEILRTNKTFRGILSTLLSVGNFLNGYDVKGFQIEYLSKVPEVKDTVHKHSLLHHLCIIVMDKFPDSTDLYSEIGAVTRASKVDFDELAANIKKVEEDCKLSWNYLKMIAKHEGHTAMKVKMSDFLADCAERIIVVGTVHKRIMSRFQKFAFWLGVPMNRISTTRPNEIFKIISEFALEYRTTRDRVLQQIKKMNREKSRSRGFLAGDGNDMVSRKMNSKEAKDDAKLKQLLNNDNYTENMYNTTTWRRQRRDTKTLLLENNNNDDEEILDALIKTANQRPVKERRRSRVYGKCCK